MRSNATSSSSKAQNIPSLGRGRGTLTRSKYNTPRDVCDAVPYISMGSSSCSHYPAHDLIRLQSKGCLALTEAEAHQSRLQLLLRISAFCQNWPRPLGSSTGDWKRKEIWGTLNDFNMVVVSVKKYDYVNPYLILTPFYLSCRNFQVKIAAECGQKECKFWEYPIKR